jgi:hypothetical protein
MLHAQQGQRRHADKSGADQITAILLAAIANPFIPVIVYCIPEAPRMADGTLARFARQISNVAWPSQSRSRPRTAHPAGTHFGPGHQPLARWQPALSQITCALHQSKSGRQGRIAVSNRD